MATITQYFEQAQLSLAAYALNLTPGISGTAYTDKLKAAGMSAAQATAFAATYTVLAQSAPTTNDFQGTLFQNVQTGQKILAIRGTENFTGYLTDLVDIAVLGGTFAQEQYASLNNFYQLLITQGKLTSSEKFNVAGHSLGGFLAQAFSVDHSGTVTQAYTYNAPGIGGAVAEVLSWLGVTNSNVAVSNIINLQASGLSVTAGLGTLLGNVQEVFTEVQNNPLNNHKIGFLADSLAIYDLLATLDPNVTTATVGGILKAASNTASTSLEKTLDALRTLFQQNYAGSNSNLNAPPTATDDRQALYSNLNALKTWFTNSPFTGFNITTLADKDAGSLLTQSQANTPDGLAYRYALYKLNPFAVSGASALYDAINADGALNRYDPATDTGNLTDLVLWREAANDERCKQQYERKVA